MSGRFEDFISDTCGAKSAEDLFAILSRALGQIGYDRLIFNILNDYDLSQKGKALGVLNTYPVKWQEYYAENRFFEIDPVIEYGIKAFRPFRWSDLNKYGHLSRAQNQLLKQGEEDAGLYNGLLIPLRGNRAQFSGFGLASSEKHDACDHRLDLINAYCNQFFICYKRMFAEDKSPFNNSIESLSLKEAEVLTWVANGKTDEEIGSILSISRHTVDTHMRHILKKLDCTNRVQAVTKAILIGMITP